MLHEPPSENFHHLLFVLMVLILILGSGSRILDSSQVNVYRKKLSTSHQFSFFATIQCATVRPFHREFFQNRKERHEENREGNEGDVVRGG